MLGFIVTLAISCAEPKIVNKTTAWNDHDKEMLMSAKKRCAEIYPSAPCVKYFAKTGDQSYQVLCAGEKAK